MKNLLRNSIGSAGALLVVITALAYWPVLSCGFVWDDDMMLTANAVVQSPQGLKDIWLSTKLADYFPLTATSLWLEWKLWGMHATGYHVTNLILHILSAILWWRILKLLAVPGAWLAALIFAVHPVNVESVAWIAERKNTLAMFFYTVALWGYQRFEVEQERASDQPGDRSGWGWYGMSLGAFLLALWSKTSGVMLPMVILLCAWWRRGRIGERDLRRSAPFFGLALVLGLVTVWFQYYSAQAAADVTARSYGAQLASAGMAVWFYLWKALWPAQLAFVYPRWEINANSPWVYLPLVALILCFAAVWRWRGGWGRPLLFGLGYFVMTLLPVLGFLKIYFQRYSLVADHWQYFSIMGVIALAVGIGVRYLETSGKFIMMARGIGVLVVGTLYFLTWQQCGVYRNVETLWRDTLAKNPNSTLAHNELGMFLENTSQSAEAREHFETALRIKPDFAEAQSNLGAVLVRAGRTEEGMAHLRRAVQINPGYDLAHYNLAVFLALAGRSEEAALHYEQTLRINPGFTDAHNRLAAVLMRLGRMPEAMAHWERAVELDPTLVDAHNNLGTALLREGRLTEAVAHFEEAVRIKPDYAKAHYNLGNALAKLDRLDEAVQHYTESLNLNPDHAEAHFNLGSALVRLERREEAVVQFQTALRLKPNYTEAKNQLQALGVQTMQ